MKSIKLLFVVTLAPIAFISKAQTPDVWQNYLDAKENGTPSTLLDYSYAGYKFSNEAIPDVSSWAKFNVTDYGAIADDDDYDDSAIQATIDAAEASDAPAVVFFPPGKFMISSDNDASKFIKIRRSNIVIKGSGQEDGGTEIFMDNHRSVNGHWQFEFAPASPNLSTLTQISGAVTRGEFSIDVFDASGLSTGQSVYISHQSEAFARAHFGELELPSTWSRLFGTDGGMSIYEPHVIASISGNQVTFVNPIQVDLPEISSSYSIRNLETISNVGMEDILFTSGWEDYGETFVHHKDDIHDYGWSAVQYEYVRDAWMRNCTFRSLSEVVDIRQSIAVTIENVDITGEKGHASFLTRRSYGVLVKDCNDEPGQHHGPGTGYSGVNTVYVRCQMQEDQSVDSHSGQPYATLIDDVQGGTFDRNGGPHESYPHHGQDLVFWNFRHTASDFRHYDFWSAWTRNGNTYAKPLFVGFQSNREVTFVEEGLNEMPGAMVEPRSLFEAQLELRLAAASENPVANFISPESGTNLEPGASVIVEVSASDPDGTVAYVDLRLGDQNLRRLATAPYKWGENIEEDPLLFNLSAGEYQLIALVTDNDDNTVSTEISITVGTPPTVSIIRPELTKLIEVGDQVEVEVSAVDTDGSISKIELYLDDQLVGIRSKAPYIWGTTESEDPLLFGLVSGGYSLKAIAFDSDNLTASDIALINVNQPPNISFRKPENGTVYEGGANIQVDINASDDDGSIIQVRLYLNGQLTRSEATSPYTWGYDQELDSTLFNMRSGQYWLKGEARDNSNSTISDSILVIVNIPLNSIGVAEHLSVYPSPFIANITISHDNQGLEHLKLVNIQGKEISVEIMQKSNETTVTPNETLSTGLYFLSFTDASGQRRIKVLKQ